MKVRVTQIPHAWTKAGRKFSRSRLPWRKIKPNRRYLEEYEEQVILRHMREIASERESPSVGLAVVDLHRHKPELYNDRELVKALRRMAHKGMVSKGRRTPWGMTYSVKEVERDKAA